MKVSLDHPLDLETSGRRLVQIDAYVTPRIDDDCPPGRFVPDEVGGVRQTGQVVLCEDHRPTLVLRVELTMGHRPGFVDLVSSTGQCRSRTMAMRSAEASRAGEGNRTLVFSLGS